MHNKALGSVKTAGGYIGEQMEDKDVVMIPFVVHEDMCILTSYKIPVHDCTGDL